jgi:predicted small lipoprotein YifL
MARSRLQILVLTLLVILMTLPILSACGKKGKPQPPQGAKTDFPRQYPTY